MSTIRRVSFQDDLGPMVETLAEAFFEDHFYSTIMSNPKRRNALLRWWMGCMLRYGLKYGEVYQYGTSGSAIAIWVGAKEPIVNPIRMFFLGLFQAPFKLGFSNLLKMFQITHRWELDQKKEPKQHWYLMVLGVKPSHQGKGEGGALVDDMVQRATSENLTCYLETSSEKNVKFYEQRKFKTLGQRTHPEAKEPFSSWSMSTR